MEVIVHCGATLSIDELTTGEIVKNRCAAPAGHEGEHCVDYWDFVYRLRRKVIRDWLNRMTVRRVPRDLRMLLVNLVSQHYLEEDLDFGYAYSNPYEDLFKDFVKHYQP